MSKGDMVLKSASLLALLRKDIYDRSIIENLEDYKLEAAMEFLVAAVRIIKQPAIDPTK